MPEMKLGPDQSLFFRDECFADAWTEPETILLLHGNAESGEAWNAWMPALGRRFRVLRPDMRGFGRSTPMKLDHPWSPDALVADFIALLDHLGIARVHVAAAKIAGPLGMRLAATHPGRVLSLTLLGTLVSGQETLGGRAASWLEHIETKGVESWARWTMPERLGSASSEAMREGWARLMGRTAQSTQLGFIRSVPGIDVRAELGRIACPTLVVTTNGSGLGSPDAVREWQRQIPGSELMILPGDSYHVAASDPEICAEATLSFIARRVG
ncbi:alpha/beta fold hydrolase [Sabulicella rubraurantiaca]|uniref:alpha/beta fold hydrolase n=1 Tax=Sabulicella rubraurantiaca TaxID=2811429 RepID=UPI001A95AEE3|nr:alpha/beta fold hydrolase [Sabulicella rubraurantiaca]